MKGLFRSVLVSGAAAAVLMVMLVSAAAPAADATKAEKKQPAVLDKSAPASVEELKAIQEHVKVVLKKVVPATVGIRIGGAAGSGVIINADGYVLTAGHVSGTPNQKCTLILPDNTQVNGKTLGRNGDIDSGLIKITDDLNSPKLKGKWSFVEMGDSAKLKRGQWCLAVGHPGGFKPGRSPVVRLGRVQMSSRGVIQSDCTLVGGDSGGPLFDMDGKVIGIHSRIGGPIIANMHVPVNTFKETWDMLVKAEPFNTAYIGIRFTRAADGLEISEVYEKTPAEKAGVKAGDVIVGIDGTKLEDREALAYFMQRKKPGDVITIEITREKMPMTLKLTLSKRQD